MLEELKRQVCEANRALVAEELVFHTFGNVSGADRASGHVVIKPSGVAYADLAPEQMAVVSLETGERVEGDLRPSSDTPTHLELYRAFEAVGGVAHTHSLHATAWAQVQRGIDPFGTTHADHFHGPVPCTRPMDDAEVEGDYEAATGRVIVERFDGIDPVQMPAVLVAQHGPFAWGADAAEAVRNAAVLEYVAHLASTTAALHPYPLHLSDGLLGRHFHRKHGPGAYYGQA